MFFLSVAASYVATELHRSTPIAARWLIRVYSRVLPKAHRRRYEEEWSAELERFGARRFAALLFAFRIALRLPNTWGAVRCLSPTPAALIRAQDPVGVRVAMNRQSIRWAGCCMPLPGDELVATRCSVHRADCDRIPVYKGHKGQTYAAEWVPQQGTLETVPLRLSVRTRYPRSRTLVDEIRGLVADLPFDVEVRTTSPRPRADRAVIVAGSPAHAVTVVQRLRNAGVTSNVSKMLENYEREG